MEKWQEELAHKMLSSNKSLPSRSLGKSALLAYWEENKSTTGQIPVPQKTIAEWQTPWYGEYDPMNHAPNGSWYGRGLPEGVDEPPATIAKLVSAIARGQDRMGGIPPSRWELSRELAEELAADAVTQWFMSGLSHSDAMKQIADGTMKICGVPIVLEKVTRYVFGLDTALGADKTIPVMFNPGRVEYVAGAVDAAVARLEAELRSKNFQILRLVAENDRMRGVLEVAMKAANPLYKVDAAPTKEDIIRGYELVCGGFGTFAEPDVAPSLSTASKPPIPMRALRTDRQTIGLREWK